MNTQKYVVLRANARSDVFAPGVDIADRGAGLVACPL